MKGTLGITPQGWKVTFEYWFIAPNGGVCDRSQLKEGLYMRELPLHPDDIPNAVDNTLVNFEVMTIATGTSEFDVMDMDVAKIV